VTFSWRSSPDCVAGLSVFVFLITEDSGDDDDEEKKRNAHVNAEQKRRDNIKTGFGELKVLLPQFKDKGNVSKAVLLRGAIDYIAQLMDVREEVLQLRRENEELRKAAGYHLLFSLFSLFSFFSLSNVSLLGVGDSHSLLFQRTF